MSKKTKISVLVALSSLIASIIAIQPVQAITDINYGIYPYNLKVGQAAVIGFELSGCEVAPTSMSVEIFNAQDEVTLNEADSNFNSKLKNETFSASWTYNGVNQKGVVAGEIFAVMRASGGCAGQPLEEMDAYGYVQNASASNVIGYIRNVETNPSVDGVSVNWSKALGATEYLVWFSESGSDHWRNAGSTTETSMVIPTEQYELEYGLEYDVRVTPMYGQQAGDERSNNYGNGFVSKVESWTSLVGDVNASPVNEFESVSQIQFNFRVENCVDKSGLVDENGIVNELWTGTLEGGRAYSGIGINEFGSSEMFSNYQFSTQGDTVTISWRLNETLPVDTYTWGAYFTGGVGCLAEGWETIFDYPFSEYKQISIIEDGKAAPILYGVDSLVKASSGDLRIYWDAPANANDGPFTYRIYDTGFSEEQSNWKLLAKTTKRNYQIKNLPPSTYVPLALKVTNSAGTRFIYLEGMTLDLYAKYGTTMNVASIAKALKYSQKVQKTLKVTAVQLLAASNTCTVKKNIIKFSNKSGVCAVKITGNRNGQNFTAVRHIWNVKK